MAKKKKQEDLEPELIDVVEETGNYDGSFLENNQIAIIGFVAGILLLIGGYLAYKFMYQAPRNIEAIEQMYQAELQFKRDSFALALENPGLDAEGFLDIAETYSGTNAGNLARYYAGICYLNLGDYNQAIEYLESYKEDGNITPVMKYGTLGDAYSQLNEFDQALKFYNKAANYENNEFLSPYYLKKYALLQAKQGNNDKALKAFHRIKEDYPNSNEGISVDKYISRLN